MFGTIRAILYRQFASPELLAAADKKKVTVFISVMGKNTYAIICDLCGLESPKDKHFLKLCDKLKDHFKPKRLQVAETYQFHGCIFEESESVFHYSAWLRCYASTCNFGDS